MKRFAVVRVEDNVVENVIVAETYNVANLFFMDNDSVYLVEESEETGIACVGQPIIDGTFVPFKQYESWLWNSESWSWEPPLPMPDDNNVYEWDESSLSWEQLDLELISQSIDEANS